jgi:hypothetical protein
LARSPVYERLEGILGEERCVVLDGGVATELQRLRPLRGTGTSPEAGQDVTKPGRNATG